MNKWYRILIYLFFIKIYISYILKSSLKRLTFIDDIFFSTLLLIIIKLITYTFILIAENYLLIFYAILIYKTAKFDLIVGYYS